VTFSFFHLMPYPYLPDDFDEKYDSTALTFPDKHFDPDLGVRLYQRYLDLAHDLIVKAWTSDELFAWYGDNYEYRYVNIWPKPVQKPHPPVYIPGAGAPRR